MATINQEDLQSIVSAVLSSIRTNSRTIEQLTPVTSLNDNDSIEVGGGKRITYGTLKQLILQLEPLLNAIDNAKITSAKVTVKEASATLTISEGKKDISASIPIVSETACGLMSTEDKKTLTKLDCVGKAGGIAPLGSNRMVPSRYMLPELYNVVEFDGLDDTAASEIGFAEGEFQTPVGEEYESHIVWLSAIGKFAATFRRKEGVSAVSLDEEEATTRAAGGTVGGGVDVGDIAVAAKKYYNLGNPRYCDEDGKPLAGKIYRSYGDGALYAATRDCQDLERLYDDLLVAAERGFIADRWCGRCFGLGDISDDGKGFTYLDLTLTHDEAMKALLLSGAPTELSHGIAPSCAEEMSPRVFLPFIADCSGGRTGLYKAFDGCATTERVKLIDKGNPDDGTFRPSTLFAAFRGCGAIDRIELDLCFIDSWQQVYCAFSGCTSLSTLRLKNLRVDLDLSDSPALSYDSVKFLIDNAANEEAVTVTLAAGPYALILNEASGEWHALLSAAAAKGIYFATI